MDPLLNNITDTMVPGKQGAFSLTHTTKIYGLFLDREQRTLFHQSGDMRAVSVRALPDAHPRWSGPAASEESTMSLTG